jgi:tetratricopeptide (TPR) repeat protein
MIGVFRNQKAAGAVLLIAVTLLVYAPIRNHEFLGLDDHQYVTENISIQQGLSLDSLSWAMTAFKEGVWNPLTWLSFMLDYQLFGLDPAGYYLTNLFLHLASVVLLFVVLHQLTGALWRSVLVAALFALHPLNVESVAWVTERKNVLSTLFGFLTMGAYVGYVRKPGWKRYFLMMGFLSLGLMAKQMLVTLPCVLLLLDYWPLGRLGETGKEFRERLPGLVLEKLPLMIPVVVASVLTLVAAQSVGGVSTLESVPLGSRVSNAILSYVLYLKKMVLPTDLAVFYPHPGALLGMGSLVLATLILVGISWGVWWRRESGYLVVGWMWYLGTLFPVSGLVQVGGQAMADRHTYVPLIGVFIMLVWGSAQLADHLLLGKLWRLGTGLCVVTTLAVLTQIHLSYWRNTTTLFERTLQVTSDNYLAYNVLGTELTVEKEFEDAVELFQEALQINPEFSLAHHNLAMALQELGRVDEAIVHFQEALEIDPEYSQAHHNLGVALMGQGKVDEAIEHYQESLKIDPQFSKAHHNLGVALVEQGKVDEAIEHYQEVLKIDPGFAQTHHNLGVALVEQGRVDEAIEHYQEVLKIDPGFAQTHHNLGVALVEKGRVDEAIEHLEESLRIRPQDAQVHYNLGVALVEQGRVEAAIEHFAEALEIDPQLVDARRNLVFVVDEAIAGYRRALQLTPDNAQMHNNLGVLLLRKGEVDAAIHHFSEAVRIDPNDRIAQENLDRTQSR